MKTLLCLLSLISIQARPVAMPDGQCTIEAMQIVPKITAMAESEKFTWFGTDQGVIKVNKKTDKTQWITTSTNALLPSNNITSIACAPDGRTWIGTCNGILFWDNSAFMIINTENSNLPDNRITALAFDRSGYLWVGMHAGGVVKTKGFRFINCYQENSILNEDIISSITADENGDVWIGLLMQGLVKISPKDAWIYYPAGENGLQARNIKFVQLENTGDYTIGTYEDGCYTLSKREFHRIMIESADSMRIRNAYRNTQKNMTVYFCEDGSYIYKEGRYLAKFSLDSYHNLPSCEALESICSSICQANESVAFGLPGDHKKQ